MSLLEEFRTYVATMPLIEERRPLYPENADMPGYDPELMFTSLVRRLDEYWYNPQAGFDDFNKEMTPPSESDPDGTFGIRSDGDFWIEAILPYRFHSLSVQEIVPILWPIVKKPVFGPDVWNEASDVA